MTLTLVTPALLWPRQVMRDTLFDAEFPALQTLIGKGRRRECAAESADGWWCAYSGISPKQFAAAPLRLAAMGIEAGDSSWLCADPVNLQINQRGAVLQDPDLLDLSEEEATQLHAAIAPLFTGVGELVMSSAAHWHVRLHVGAPSLPTRLSDHIGQSAAAFLPAGSEDRHWRQLLNEVQMTLHAHPVNQTRKMPINSLALWGLGRLPPMLAQGTGTLLCDDPVIAGLGKLSGLQVLPLSTGLSVSSHQTLVHWDELRASTASHDALAWRDVLQKLDSDWVAPALAAIAAGKLNRIELQMFGENEAVSLTMSSLDRFRFWQKPRRLESL